MKISEAQARVKSLEREPDKKYDRGNLLSSSFVDMVDNLGKLARMIRSSKCCGTLSTDALETELTVIFRNILIIANIYNIDLEKAFIKRIQCVSPK